VTVRVAVIGLGSIGRRHAANFELLGCSVVGGRLEDVVAARPEAVVIAAPTSEHLTVLRWAVENGVHAYVEKPIAHEPTGVADVLSAAEAAGLTIAVGYNLRFHPALEAIRDAVAGGRIGPLLSARAEVGQYLPDWQADRDYRTSYSARRDLGGGALLTLSHELDYVRWIAGDVTECRGMVGHVSALELDVDDVAEVVCRHEGGALTSVHMDMLDRSYVRRSRWVGADATIAWEWNGPVTLLPDGVELWADPAFDLGDTYVAAARDFLESVRDGGRPRCDGRDGLRVLELASEVLGEH
jgi:predicted dehydrogenase